MNAVTASGIDHEENTPQLHDADPNGTIVRRI